MSTRSRVFLDIESRVSSGRVFIELYNDLAPKASENFRRLCVGDQISCKASLTDANTDSAAQLESKKSNKQKQKKFSLKNVRFHRIVAPEFIVQAGEDLDGESIYHNTETDSYYFAGENNSAPANERGLVCMANENGDPNKNTSQFFVTLQSGLGIEGCTIFGRIVRGMEVLDGLEDVVVDKEDRPAQGDEVFIKRSGELELKSKGKSEVKTQTTNEITTDKNAGTAKGEKSVKETPTTEIVLEKEPSKNVSEGKLTEDDKIEKQSEKDTTSAASNKSNFGDTKDLEHSEPASIQKESKSLETLKPLVDDKDSSRQSRREDYDHDRRRRHDSNDRRKYDHDERNRHGRDYRSQFDSRSYEKNDRGLHNRSNREDRHRRWDDRRPYNSHRDDERQKDKDQPKVIFKGRGSMKYKDREFGRL